MRLAFFLLTIVFAAYGAPSIFQSDIDKTLAEAKKEKKPLIVDFYGVWCPPCNQLDETVFNSPAFLEKAKKFKLLKVDADAEVSWKIKSQYKITGYPTILFLNPDGKEIYRFVGYQTPRETARIMDLVLAAKGKSLDQSCGSKKTDDLYRCAMVCWRKDDKACAATAFKKLEGKLKVGTVEYDFARTFAAETATPEEMKRDAYERLMKESPSSPAALLWAMDYVGSFPSDGAATPKKEALDLVLAKYSEIVKNPNAEKFGLSQTDMPQIRAMIMAKSGRTDEAKVAWKEAADLLSTKAGELPKGTDARGYMIERIGALDESGNFEEALKLSNEYRGKYPEEFTFHYWSASLLKEQKKFNDALPIAHKAFEHSYGDNKVRAGTLLIKLYATVPNKDAAKKVYEEVKKDVHPDANLDVRTHRYLKAIDEEYKKVAG